MSPTMNDLKGSGEAHTRQHHPTQKLNAKDSPISKKFLWEALYATTPRKDFTSICITRAVGVVCVCWFGFFFFFFLLSSKSSLFISINSCSKGRDWSSV